MDNKKKAKDSVKTPIAREQNLVLDIIANGIPFLNRSVADLAEEYLSKYHTKQQAARKLINNQILKVSSSGGLAGLSNTTATEIANKAGNALYAANITTALYVQVRMVAAIALIGGYDILDDEVKGQMYKCFLSNAISDAIKLPTTTIARKTFEKLIKSIPYERIKDVNQKMGYRFITKNGKNGVINLTSLIPLACAIATAGLDAISTKLIGVAAYNMFIENASEESIIEVNPIA